MGDAEILLQVQVRPTMVYRKNTKEKMQPLLVLASCLVDTLPSSAFTLRWNGLETTTKLLVEVFFSKLCESHFFFFCFMQTVRQCDLEKISHLLIFVADTRTCWH